MENRQTLPLHKAIDEIKIEYDAVKQESISTEHTTSSGMMCGAIKTEDVIDLTDIKAENDDHDMECGSTTSNDFDTDDVKVEIIQDIITPENDTNIDMMYRSILPSNVPFIPYQQYHPYHSVQFENCMTNQNGASKSGDVFLGSEEDEPPSDEDKIGSAPLSRRALVFLPPPEDTREEALLAGRIDEPLGSDDTKGLKGLFDFQWSSFPKSKISPLSRREVFVGDVGPTLQNGPNLSPYLIFVDIWDRKIMERIAIETNRYGEKYAACHLETGQIGPRSGISGWRNTDIKELYVYFALIIAMGILVKSKLEDYWNRSGDVFLTPGLSAQMSLRRFQLLSRCLHFVDNQTISRIEQSRAEAKVSKVRPLINYLNAKFQKLYRLGQNISLDKSLTQWKGWSNRKQSRRQKESAEGIKSYEVCDSHTGYLWRFDVHAGSGIDRSEQTVIPGQIPNLVLWLLRGLENRGHTVWMDNYYNSPALARVLKIRGFDCVGTLRINRQFVPKEITVLKRAGLEVGWVGGVTAGDVDVVVWQGQQSLVAILSTYHGVDMYAGKPTIIQEYSMSMCGLERKDQVLSANPMEGKRLLVWYKKFFRRLLNVSVFNAYVIYKWYHPTINEMDFRVKLFTSILEHWGHKREMILSADQGKFSPDVVAHLPAQLPLVAVSGKNVRSRRLCVMCKTKRTPIFCKACDVSLCYDFEDQLSCYVKYHS